MKIEAAERRTGIAGSVAPLLASTGISVTGDGAFITAAALLAASLTRNPVTVSAVAAAFFLPWLMLGLPVGALVDRWPRRPVMVAADLTRAAILVAFLCLMAAGQATVSLLIVVVICVGAAQCFFDSAAQAVIPAIAGRDKDMLAHVNGRFWSLDTAGRSLLGPPLGSLTFTLSRILPFAIDAMTFVISAALIRRLPPIPSTDGLHERITAAVAKGVKHIAGTPDLRVLTLINGVFNFTYCAAIGVFVLYARHVLGLPSAAYGLILAASGIGGVAAGWRARSICKHLSYRQIMAVASAIQALVWFSIVVTANAWVTGALFIVYGAGASLASVAVGSARQALTPDALLGRVVSASRLIAVGAAAIGALVGGALAKVDGLPAALVFSASIAGASSVVLSFPIRNRMRVPRSLDIQ